MANTKPASKKPKNTSTTKPSAKKAAVAAPPAKKAAPNVDAIKQLSERIQSVQVELEGLNTTVGEHRDGDSIHERLEKIGADLAERGDAIMDVLRPFIPDDDADEDDDALDPFAEIDKRFTIVEKSLGLIHAKLDAMIANFGVPYEAPPEPALEATADGQPAGDDQGDGEAQPAADTVDENEDENEDEDEDDDQDDDDDGADNAGSARPSGYR